MEKNSGGGSMKFVDVLAEARNSGKEFENEAFKLYNGKSFGPISSQFPSFDGIVSARDVGNVVNRSSSRYDANSGEHYLVSVKDSKYSDRQEGGADAYNELNKDKIADEIYSYMHGGAQDQNGAVSKKYDKIKKMGAGFSNTGDVKSSREGRQYANFRRDCFMLIKRERLSDSKSSNIDPRNFSSDIESRKKKPMFYLKKEDPISHEEWVYRVTKFLFDLKRVGKSRNDFSAYNGKFNSETMSGMEFISRNKKEIKPVAYCIYRNNPEINEQSFLPKTKEDIMKMLGSVDDIYYKKAVGFINGTNDVDGMIHALKIYLFGARTMSDDGTSIKTTFKIRSNKAGQYKN